MAPFEAGGYTEAVCRKEDMPPIRKCEGCCVKMVQFIGTGELM
jgi:hypothetical protein